MAFAVGPAKSTCEYILATALVAVCLVKAAAAATPGENTAGASGAAAAPATATWWQPSRNEKFQYQLSVALDPDKHFIPGVQVYIVDAFDTPADAVAALKAKGDASAPVVPVCYISAGTWEDWRPDAGDFADSDKGAALGNWPGEYYANLRSDNVRAIMRRRMEMCRDKGFLAVDADNVDAYSNANGLGLTAEDQLDYNTWLAATAHELGLGMGLKNNLNQMAQLAPLFDFFVNEQCHVYNECQLYAPAIAAGKPVWNIEYDPDAFKAACRSENPNGPPIRSIFKRVKLDFCWHDCASTNLDCPEPQTPDASSGATAPPVNLFMQLLCLALAWQLARSLC